MTANVASGSFRDPAGRVFERDGEIYRRVSRCAESQFVVLTQSGFYQKAEAAGFYIGHEEVAEKGETDLASDARVTSLSNVEAKDGFPLKHD
jgi:hypothetical protein